WFRRENQMAKRKVELKIDSRFFAHFFGLEATGEKPELRLDASAEWKILIPVLAEVPQEVTELEGQLDIGQGIIFAVEHERTLKKAPNTEKLQITRFVCNQRWRPYKAVAETS